MINILLGAPGGGKSYEAVVFHILEALLSGRKVITNLELFTEEFDKIQPGLSRLISFRHPSKDNPVPFSTLRDYGDSWRDGSGRGPLYVIDEAHKPLPRGRSRTDVEEWFAEHRHEGADVLLMSQGLRKLSGDVVDLLQIVYRVRKNVVLGSMNSYTRKVQDGPRGEVLNQTVRVYQKKYFSLYKSHTRTDGAVQEAMTQDVRPIWRHWSFVGAALLIPLAIVLLYSAGNPMEAGVKVAETGSVQGQPVEAMRPVSVPVVGAPVRTASSVVSASSPSVAKMPVEVEHPYNGYAIHVRGYIYSEESRRVLYQFSISQNGQRVFDQNQLELTRAGYVVQPVNDCAAKLTYRGYSFYALCDLPQIAMSPGQNFVQ